MTKTRLEAFSDGVIAILITIMVLELKVPHHPDWASLGPLLPVFLSYVLSFIFLGIYWANHHHLLHTCDRVSGGILWANLHLLFWLSLVPFFTGWMGENHNAPLPTAGYAVDLLMCGVAYLVLEKTIVAHHGPDSKLASAIGNEWKGKVSALAYVAAVPLAFLHVWISDAIFVAVAAMWLVPDRRIEARLREHG